MTFSKSDKRFEMHIKGNLFHFYQSRIKLLNQVFESSLNMQYFLSVFLAGLAITSALKSLSDYDWTEIRSPMKELEAVEKNDFTFGLSSRIVGGSVATVNQFPHQAALILTSSSGGQFFCGGSIIAAKVILTAAHCVYE